MSRNREILMLAAPAIISNITTPILAMVDTAIVGHIGAATYIGAIAVGGSMFNLIYWVMNFLRMGSSGMTAQAYGAGDSRAAYSVMWRGLVVAMACALLLWILSAPVCHLMLWFMGADAETSTLASTYFYIVVIGAPAVLCNYALSGWFLGMQDSRTPMMMSVLTNVINIIVSLVLVFCCGMKIEGVAFGTLSAQWVGLAFGVAVVFLKYRPGRPVWHDVFASAELRRFFSINIDIFLRTACLVAVTLWFTRAGARQGENMLAANAILMQLFLFFSYFMDGFAFAGEALAGKYYGAGDRGGLRASVRGVMRWGVGVAVAFTLLYIVGGSTVVRILTDDAQVLSAISDFLPWAAAVPLAGFAAFAWDGVYTGLTMTRKMTVSMFTAMCIFFLGYYLLEPRMGNHGLWLAFVLYLATRGAMQTLLYRHGIR